MDTITFIYKASTLASIVACIGSFLGGFYDLGGFWSVLVPGIVVYAHSWLILGVGGIRQLLGIFLFMAFASWIGLLFGQGITVGSA